MVLNLFFLLLIVFSGVSIFVFSLLFIFISNFTFFEGGDKYVSLSLLRFVGRFSCHDSSNLLSTVGWLRSSSSLLFEYCSSLSPNTCVKILVSFFDIFPSVFEYESTNCLCEPRLLEYVLLIYSATVARSSVLSSFFVLKNSSA